MTIKKIIFLNNISQFYWIMRRSKGSRFKEDKE